MITASAGEGAPASQPGETGTWPPVASGTGLGEQLPPVPTPGVGLQSGHCIVWIVVGVVGWRGGFCRQCKRAAVPCTGELQRWWKALSCCCGLWLSTAQRGRGRLSNPVGGESGEGGQQGGLDYVFKSPLWSWGRDFHCHGVFGLYRRDTRCSAQEIDKLG